MNAMYDMEAHVNVCEYKPQMHLIYHRFNTYNMYVRLIVGLHHFLGVVNCVIWKRGQG